MAVALSLSQDWLASLERAESNLFPQVTLTLTPNPNPKTPTLTLTQPSPNPNPDRSFSAQALDYLEELGLDFRSDRVGKTWLAVEADAVAEWCAQDSAPEEVRSGSRL